MIHSKKYVRRPIYCQAVEITRDNIEEVVKWLNNKGVKAVTAGTGSAFPVVNFMSGSDGENAEIGEIVYVTGKGQAARIDPTVFHESWVLPEPEPPTPAAPEEEKPKPPK